jgi:hypothetical protein
MPEGLILVVLYLPPYIYIYINHKYFVVNNYLSVPDEGYSEHLMKVILGVPDEGYSERT